MIPRSELVRKAIHFGRPERVPIWFVNCDQTEGDAIVYHLSLYRAGEDPPATNEWGYRLQKLGDGTMGHPTHPALPDWELAEQLVPPPLREEERMAGAAEFFRLCEDRYRLASLDLSGFTVYMLLRGFQNSMTDFLIEPEKAGRLLDLIFDWECEVMRLCARSGIPRHPLCRRLGDANRVDGFAPLVAAAVQTALSPAVRLGPPIGARCVVPLLRQRHGPGRGPARNRRIGTEPFAT